MSARIFALPSSRKSTKAWEISSCISLLLHGLLLGAFGFAFPVNMDKQQEEASISIDLEMLADNAPPKENSARQEEIPVAQEEAPPPEPEPAPVETRPEPKPKKTPPPKPAPKKAEAKKPAVAPKIAEAGSNVSRGETAANSKPQAAKPASAPARPPAQLGGAHSPRPPYPELARKRGQEGTVNVRCNVDAQGKVVSVSLAKSSGFKLLDEAALKAVGKWKFKPGEKDGASVAGIIVVPVQFKLQ